MQIAIALVAGLVTVFTLEGIAANLRPRRSQAASSPAPLATGWQAVEPDTEQGIEDEQVAPSPAPSPVRLRRWSAGDPAPRNKKLKSAALRPDRHTRPQIRSRGPARGA